MFVLYLVVKYQVEISLNLSQPKLTVASTKAYRSAYGSAYVVFI